MAHEVELSDRRAIVEDARLCFGNGHVLGSFVGPLEFPEKPMYAVHDKISRLWLGYSSPPLPQVGLAPCITDIKTGAEWVVGACDRYRFEDGAVIMETALPVGTVVTATYGIWDEPVFVRCISFTPNKGLKQDFQISTTIALYRDYSDIPPDDDPQAIHYYNVYNLDERERPPSYSFPKREMIHLGKDRLVEWDYNDPRYRKIVMTIAEETSTIEVLDHTGFPTEKNTLAFEGTSAGVVRLKCPCRQEEGTLTVVLSFARDLCSARKMMERQNENSISLKSTQRHWRDWFDSGAVVVTGHQKLDQAYRTQMMYAKVGLDAELGGHIVGARYQIPTVWTRDTGVVSSILLDAGHYPEVRKILLFFPEHAYWNEKNNCLHANYHASGRVIGAYCAPGQRPVEEITQPGEWANQMCGPQLDGMAYYLYAAGKYHRYTNDTNFIKKLWPFILKVADSLARDDYCLYEGEDRSGYLDGDGRFKKYNEETGLIVDNCMEDDILGEYLLTNGIAILGFREAYRLSQVIGEEKPLWKKRSKALQKAFREHLIKIDPLKGPIFIKNVPRPWLGDGKAEPLGDEGYLWTIATTVPLLNHRDQVFKNAFRHQVNPTGEVTGWGIWWAAIAQAAFEADLADVGWNYLSKLLARLPKSLQIYEHSQEVTELDGKGRRVALSLWSYSYLVHAVIRGLGGFGYDEHSRNWFFRPQIPEELGIVKASFRIGTTRFDVKCTGRGDSLVQFRIDGIDIPRTEGILPVEYIDGRQHEIIITMAQSKKGEDSERLLRHSSLFHSE